MFIALSPFVILGISVAAFVRLAKFGRFPSGERLERIKKSLNYKDGKFQNLSKTSVMTEGVNQLAVFKELIFTRNKKPLDNIPTVKTDLKKLEKNQDVLVWFGHSSCFVQIDGKKILIDPVFSGNASPVFFTTRAFKGSDLYKAEDMPEIDYLFITHDHWDHLDYETVIRLKPKIKNIICALGVGEYFEYWGFEKERILEKDWNEEIKLGDGFFAYPVPARHFSGRAFTRNKTLWAAFVFVTPTFRLFISGDGGYDSHFEKIGHIFGGFDLVILENGQYDKSWKYIHMSPEEVVQAAKDLQAKRVFPFHSSKFTISNHAWSEPLKRITELNKKAKLNLITPKIGEVVDLKNEKQAFVNWWEGVK